MIFHTGLINSNSVERLFFLMDEYPATHQADQFIFNLYLNCERKLWKPLPVKDKFGFLYDYAERNRNRKEDYVMLKYPGWSSAPKLVEILNKR